MAALIPKVNATTGSATAPGAGALVTGELAENKFTGRLYVKTESAAVVDPSRVILTGDVTGSTATATSEAQGGTIVATLGTVGVTKGGTGLIATPANGQIAIGNGTGYTLATLTAGANISITNSAGSITIAGGASNTVKAWVNFNGTTSGTWAGGTSTVTRASGSTTATISTASNHNLITGSTVYALTGVAAGAYVITLVSATSFTIQTVATTTLSAVSITFQGSTINASYNVSSITKHGTGIYTVNFATALADVNYAATVSAQPSSSGNPCNTIPFAGSGATLVSPTTTSMSIFVENFNFSAGVDSALVSVQIFGN